MFCQSQWRAKTRVHVLPGRSRHGQPVVYASKKPIPIGFFVFREAEEKTVTSRPISGAPSHFELEEVYLRSPQP